VAAPHCRGTRTSRVRPSGCRCDSRIWDDPQFVEDLVAVSDDASRALIERRMRIVGVDGFSVAPYDEQTSMQVTLLARWAQRR
jgi:kynurenine formamidase